MRWRMCAPSEQIIRNRDSEDSGTFMRSAVDMAKKRRKSASSVGLDLNIARGAEHAYSHVPRQEERAYFLTPRTE